MRDQIVIPGTDIEVHRIAALFKGMTIEDIMADYPSLTREQIETARLYAEANPSEKSYPSITVKKALKELAESGVWDIEDVDDA